MNSTLIVAKMRPDSGDDVAKLFGEFDETEMPGLMGTRRRQLFRYHGLYFHLQDFDDDMLEGGAAIEEARQHPLFVNISNDLKPFIEPYDPDWQRPADAMAERFYLWQGSS
jgi:cyclase